MKPRGAPAKTRERSLCREEVETQRVNNTSEGKPNQRKQRLSINMLCPSIPRGPQEQTSEKFKHQKEVGNTTRWQNENYKHKED